MIKINQFEELLHSLNVTQANLDDIFIYLDEFYINDKTIKSALDNMTIVNFLIREIKKDLEENLIHVQ